MREQHVDAIQAVDLHQVEHVGPQAALRLFDHRDALGEIALGRRDLGGDEGLLAIADVGEQFANDFF